VKIQMAFLNCNCRDNCTLLAVGASLLLGVIAAFLQITVAITVTPAFLWVLLGIAVGYLAIGVATSCNRCERVCKGSALSAFLTGALGTALLSVILLGVSFAAGSVIGAIFVGALIFFAALLLSSAACLVRARCEE
jgi:xanthosine utilization system XapX-like protein